MKKASLTLLFYLTVLSLKAQEVRGRYEPYMDDEDIADQKRREAFQFDNFEMWSMLVGAILLIIGWSLLQKNKKTKNEEGCLPIGMMILGVILIAPLIIGILGVVNKIIYYGLILAFVAFVLYVIVGIIKSFLDKNK